MEGASSSVCPGDKVQSSTAHWALLGGVESKNLRSYHKAHSDDLWDVVETQSLKYGVWIIARKLPYYLPE